MKDPHLNQTLGPYHLRRIVGRGGMGTVYASIDQNTGDEVAVKILSPALASEKSFRDRFSSEIESLKRLRHPNIVRLFGYGEQDGQLYYSMELIRGHSLQHELKQGRRFTWRDVTTMSIDVCGALKHAHDHGIIHRDLKPANLLCTRDDEIKLLDFGIAKLFGNTGVTTGNVMGTADYMAPEQAEGKAVGPRTDLYSLGSVMYALLSGRPPFVGGSVPEVVHKVRFEPPVPVGRIAPDVPVELEHLIEQLLEKDPRKRIPTALATSHRLKAMEHALSVQLETMDTPVDASVSSAPPPPVPPKAQNEQETIQLDDDASEAGVNRLTVMTRGNDGDSDEGTGPDHFTAVKRQRDVEQPPLERFGQTVWLAILLAAVIGTSFVAIRRAMRPATADELYTSIVETFDPEAPSSLVGIENELSDFTSRFPDDARVDEVNRLTTELELFRLQRQLEESARRRRPSLSLSPIGEIYLNILRISETDPDKAVERLQALLDVYDHAGALSDDDQPYMALARRRLDTLQSRLSQQTQSQLPLIRRQLSRARRLAESDPDQAERIFVGIIHLYAGQSWASEAVETAKMEMKALARPRQPGGKDELDAALP